MDRRFGRAVVLIVVFLEFLPIHLYSATYRSTSIEPGRLEYPPVKSVDLSQYTPEAIGKFMADAMEDRHGYVTLSPVKGLIEMRMLYSGDKLFKMGLRQGALPQALYIQEGVVSLQEVSEKYPELLVEKQDNVFLAKLPLVVSAGATLIIKNCILMLSEERGSCIANGGKIFIVKSKIFGWREKTDQPAVFTGDKKEFRPFFISWAASRSYFSESELAYLGYHRSKSYGVTFSTYLVKPNEKIFANSEIDFTTPPTGWVVNSTFRDIYYGFYCYEAENIIIVNNVFANNITYGIDPHDRSGGLVIAGNEVYGTKKKHGIIISREVNDSYIIGNRSHDNKISGIMLDRQCKRNLISNNILYGNGGDGLTLYESGENTVYNNLVLANKSHGIRLRNSEDVVMLDNTVLNNRKYGIYLHTRDLVNTERNLKFDPYRQVVSGKLFGGTVSYNRSGSIYLEDFEEFTVYGVMIENRQDGKLKLGGAAEKFHGQVARAISGGDVAIAIAREEE